MRITHDKWLIVLYNKEPKTGYWRDLSPRRDAKSNAHVKKKNSGYRYIRESLNLLKPAAQNGVKQYQYHLRAWLTVGHVLLAKFEPLHSCTHFVKLVTVLYPVFFRTLIRFQWLEERVP